MTAPPPQDPLPPDPLSSTGAAWWDGLAPAQISLECGAAKHVLRWAEGRLTAVDHPDADRERALVALGGEHVACLDVFDAWHRHSDDLDLLVLLSRGPSDRLPEPQTSEHVRYSGSYNKMGWTMGAVGVSNFGSRSARRLGRGWTSYRPLDDEDHDGEVTVGQLANLGGGLNDRLVATIIATWTERIEAGDERVAAVSPKLHAALYGRIVTTIRGLTREATVVDLVMVDSAARRAVTMQDGHISVALPFSWLIEIWGKDLATVLGHLCLSVEQSNPDLWQLRVADRTLTGQRTITVDFADRTSDST